ncbi:hypothetical protein Trydic_g10323 [Trypoxylus dichotomus]
MFIAIVLLILLPFVLWLVYYYWSVHHFEKYLKNIPGPRRTPLFGNALDFPSPINILPQMLEFYEKYKRSYKIYFGMQPFLVITDPKDLEFAMNHQSTLGKSNFYKLMNNWLGTGLLTASGDKWKKHRRIITPAFHFQILEQFIDIFNSQSEILVSILKREHKNCNIDVYPYIGRCTLDIICETAMGTTVNAQEDVNSEYFKCIVLLWDIIFTRFLSPILSNDFMYRFSSTYRKEKYALKVVHGYIKSVIQRRKQERLKNSAGSEEVIDSLGRRRKKVFLDLLLDYSMTDPEFTEEHIREEVDTFMFEGHDTTATAITFALENLARNPDVQRKAYEEVRTIFSDNPTRNTTHRDLQEMRYLELVIKESLRLHTTVPLISRKVEHDTEWNGITLPKGLMLMLCMHGVHHSSDIHKDPEKFDPERYTAENTRTKHPYASVPFSAGPRNCIGQRFAMLEMKSTISHVLRNFDLLPPSPDHKIMLTSAAVLKSANGVYIRLKPRT